MTHDIHIAIVRIVFVTSEVRRAPRAVLHRNPCGRNPLELNIERVQYATRRPSFATVIPGRALIHLHNLPARMLWARSFTDFIVPVARVVRFCDLG